jgi:hypothetical protein
MRGDGAFSLSNRYDLSWYASVYKTLVGKQTDQSGNLICSISNTVIALNANGKPTYISASQTPHEECPKINHFRPDWMVRLTRLDRLSECRCGRQAGDARSGLQRASFARNAQILQSRPPPRATSDPMPVRVATGYSAAMRPAFSMGPR